MRFALFPQSSPLHVVSNGNKKVYFAFFFFDLKFDFEMLIEDFNAPTRFLPNQQGRYCSHCTVGQIVIRKPRQRPKPTRFVFRIATFPRSRKKSADGRHRLFAGESHGLCLIDRDGLRIFIRMSPTGKTTPGTTPTRPVNIAAPAGVVGVSRIRGATIK